MCLSDVHARLLVKQTKLSYLFNFGRDYHHSSVYVLHVDVWMCEREEGSDHAATIKLSLLQKVPVSEIVLFLECVC